MSMTNCSITCRTYDKSHTTLAEDVPNNDRRLNAAAAPLAGQYCSHDSGHTHAIAGPPAKPLPLHSHRHVHTAAPDAERATYEAPAPLARPRSAALASWPGARSDHSHSVGSMAAKLT